LVAVSLIHWFVVVLVVVLGGLGWSTCRTRNEGGGNTSGRINALCVFVHSRPHHHHIHTPWPLPSPPLPLLPSLPHSHPPPSLTPSLTHSPTHLYSFRRRLSGASQRTGPRAVCVVLPPASSDSHGSVRWGWGPSAVCVVVVVFGQGGVVGVVRVGVAPLRCLCCVVLCCAMGAGCLAWTWVDGWMDGWMDGICRQMDGWMDEWMDGRRHTTLMAYMTHKARMHACTHAPTTPTGAGGADAAGLEARETKVRNVDVHGRVHLRVVYVWVVWYSVCHCHCHPSLTYLKWRGAFV
jgi:hypothetical protein